MFDAAGSREINNMADIIGQLLLEEQKAIESGKYPNPWLDEEFNSCELDLPEPGASIDDTFERIGGGGTTVEGSTTTTTGGPCYWIKRGSDIYYLEGGAAVGTPDPKSDEYKFHTEDGNLGAIGVDGEDTWVDAVGVW